MRPLLTVIGILAVLGVSACGSQSRVAETRPAQRLPQAVASSLAARSDALARALQGGDACEARIQVHGLERQTRLAIAAGRVPRVYRARLLAAAERLASQMPSCVPPAAPPPAVAPRDDGGDHGDRGKGKGKDRGKKHDEGGNEQ